MRLYVGLILAVSLALWAGLATFGWVRTGEALEAAEGRAVAAETALRQANLEAEVRSNAAKSRDQELRDLRKEYAGKQKELQDALKANPEWADGTIPADVLRSLR